MKFSERYDRNKRSLSDEQQQRLSASSVLVLGCGGIGGYVIEYLSRIGIGNITAVDADVFQESNLNRQLLSTEENIGVEKTAAAKARVNAINSQVVFQPVTVLASEDNINDLANGKDVIIDCLDNPGSKLACAKASQRLGIPFVHGAISGWCVRVHTVLPGDEIMELLCSSGGGTEKLLGNLSFTASACACLEAAEAVKLILGIGETTADRLIEMDLLTMHFDEIDIG